MTLDIYHKLAEHLDHLPGGFPPSKTGAHLRVLRRLFTQKEAELATYMTLDREEPRTIAEKAKIPLMEARRRLDEMAIKGLIFSVDRGDGVVLFQAAPWVVGIYEFQVKNLNEDLLKDIDDYYATRESVEGTWTLNQLRTIPIGESIDAPLNALPYDKVEELIDAHTKFGVAPCICRTHMKKEGRGCDAPIETCLLFGDFADFYIRTGRGRSISKTEVKEILARANESNLVLNPTNSKFVSAICCCCGCCCGILGGLKQYDKPAEVVISSFTANFEPSVCINCGKCLSRCQMQAMSNEDGKMALNPDRCIGCGLCVSTCPSGALTLKHKPRTNGDIPETFSDTWYRFVREQEEKR